MKSKIIAVDYSKNEKSSFWFIFLLIILAASLRFYKLGSQLWSDEINALSGYRRPFIEIFTTFPDYFPHPLYELLAHSSLLIFGENPFSLRFPSAIFGAAGVIALFFLAIRLLGKWEALLACF